MDRSFEMDTTDPLEQIVRQCISVVSDLQEQRANYTAALEKVWKHENEPEAPPYDPPSIDAGSFHGRNRIKEEGRDNDNFFLDPRTSMDEATRDPVPEQQLNPENIAQTIAEKTHLLHAKIAELFGQEYLFGNSALLGELRRDMETLQSPFNTEDALEEALLHISDSLNALLFFLGAGATCYEPSALRQEPVLLDEERLQQREGPPLQAFVHSIPEQAKDINSANTMGEIMEELEHVGSHYPESAQELQAKLNNGCSGIVAVVSYTATADDKKDLAHWYWLNEGKPEGRRQNHEGRAENAMKDGVFGYAISKERAKRVSICNFAVHPAFRHRGLEEDLVVELVKTMIDRKRSILSITIPETALDMLVLFQGMGFVAQKNLIKGVYPEEDGIICALNLEHPHENALRIIEIAKQSQNRSVSA
ncbi:MAG: hypothetical protein Q7R81_01455 [Candidatus Peregrinibacteria bacterium]|nr:hypothetical protein [Candidatus Peregrinibacteria bacterium]